MDLNNIHNQVLKIAEQASELSLKFFRKEDHSSLKADDSVVTLADTELNSFLISELSKIDSSIGFIVEESKQQDIKDYNWIIDPIDGTNNYYHGLELWGINIALWHKNEPVYGIMYFPMLIEKFVYFIKDNGAFNYKNEKMIFKNKKKY